MRWVRLHGSLESYKSFSFKVATFGRQPLAQTRDALTFIVLQSFKAKKLKWIKGFDPF
jgi:hypothetical protein